MQASQYKFCPFCGDLLETRIEDDGAPRQYCVRCRWTYYPHAAQSVGGVLVVGDRVLLVRRKKEPFPGTWMFPSGFIEYGEHPHDAAIREFLEETGLRVDVGEACGLYISSDDPREPGHLAFFFRVHNPVGVLRNDASENLELAWFQIYGLPQIVLVNHARVAKDLTSGNSRVPHVSGRWPL